MTVPVNLATATGGVLMAAGIVWSWLGGMLDSPPIATAGMMSILLGCSLALIGGVGS